MTHSSQKSFLLFAKGACGEDSPLHKVAGLIEPQLEEIRLYEAYMRGNNARPTNLQQMLQKDGWTTYLEDRRCLQVVRGYTIYLQHIASYLKNLPAEVTSELAALAKLHLDST